MEINTIYTGDCLEYARSLPAEFVDSVVTSPPYWQLRDYGYPEQWGLEPTYQEYLTHLWTLMDEIWRVLKPGGTVWVNLGDTYGGSGSGGGGNEKNGRGYFDGRATVNETSKCLLLIPHRFAIGCVDRGWIMRNDCIWAKRNGMPESVTDRFSKKHEYFFFMVKSQNYYFDLDAVREEAKMNSGWAKGKANGVNINAYTKTQNTLSSKFGTSHTKGKNPGTVSDFWDVPTKPSKKDHYATFNADLIDKPILAGCPEGGIVYDPFAGSGTTLLRAYQLKRRFIGSEGNPEYVRDFEKQFAKEKAFREKRTADEIALAGGQTSIFDAI